MDTSRQQDCGCGHVREVLEEYVHAELDSRERAALDAHLRSCPECTNAHRLSLTLTSVIVRGCREQAPIELRRRVIARIETMRDVQ